eukprot:3612-Pyramimonas_sp.AAC.1
MLRFRRGDFNEHVHAHAHAHTRGAQGPFFTYDPKLTELLLKWAYMNLLHVDWDLAFRARPSGSDYAYVFWVPDGQ